jgi:hypothetical protein
MLARRRDPSGYLYELFMTFALTNSLWTLERFLTASASTIEVVLDLVFVALVMVFFVVSAGYVAACDRLMK